MGGASVRQCKGGKDCHEEEHLCRVAANKDIERVRKAVKEAAYFCRKCGRAPRIEEHLCKPSKIQPEAVTSWHTCAYLEIGGQT